MSKSFRYSRGGETWIHRFPDCPWCGHKWQKVEKVDFLVSTVDDMLQTVILCPCRKSGIKLDLQVIEKAFVDIEGAKHYGKRPAPGSE